MIGGALGNMDAVLNTPYVVILGLTAILVMLALRKPGRAFSSNGRAVFGYGFFAWCVWER